MPRYIEIILLNQAAWSAQKLNGDDDAKAFCEKKRKSLTSLRCSRREIFFILCDFFQDSSGKQTTVTFQATSIEDRKQWISVMDGKEPEYISTRVGLLGKRVCDSNFVVAMLIIFISVSIFVFNMKVCSFPY